MIILYNIYTYTDAVWINGYVDLRDCQILKHPRMVCFREVAGANVMAGHPPP